MGDVHTLDIAGNRDDEMLCRLIDGECTPEERLEIEERLANEPQLRDRLSAFRSNDSALRSAFNQGADSIPTQVLHTLAGLTPRQERLRTWRWPVAIAASALVATLTLLIANPWGDAAPGAPGIDDAIASALEKAPSRAAGWEILDDDRRMRLVLTFPAADGQWCREFMLASSEHHWRGVACRGEDSWVTQVIGRDTFLSLEGGYRTASASVNEAIEAFIDQSATDIALSGDEESRLIASGWATDNP